MLDHATFVKGVAQWIQLPGDGRPEIADLGIERTVLLTSAETNRGISQLRRWLVEQIET